jgi:hypothetical protein
MPPTNDPLNPDAIGGSERDVRRACLAIHWPAVAAVAVALALFYVFSTNADEPYDFRKGLKLGASLAEVKALGGWQCWEH